MNACFLYANAAFRPPADWRGPVGRSRTTWLRAIDDNPSASQDMALPTIVSIIIIIIIIIFIIIIIIIIICRLQTVQVLYYYSTVK